MSALNLTILEVPVNISVSDPSLSAGTTTSLLIAQGLPGSNYIAAGSVTAHDGVVQFVNSNGFTFGMNTLNQITGSVDPTAANFQAVSASGNTAGTLSAIGAGTAVLAGGNNITLSQSGNTITISGQTVPAKGQTVYEITTYNSIGSATRYAPEDHYHAGVRVLGLSGNTLGNTQTVHGDVIIAGGNNITVSGSTNSAGITMTVSGPNTVAQSQQPAVGSLNGSSGSLSVVVGGALGLTNNASTISITAPTQTVQTQNVHNATLSGNTAGVMAQISSGTLTLAGGNNITLSQNGNAVTISGVNTVVQTVQPAVGSLNGSSGTMSIVAGGAIGLTNNASTISITAPTQTVQPIGMASMSLSGNSATTNSSNITSGGFALAGGNGVTLAQSNNTISISVATNYQSQGAYLTTAAQSTQTIAISLGGNSGTTNSSNITAGGYVLAGGNNITLNQSNNTVSIVGPATVAQTNQTLSWAATSNTAGNTSGVTVDARSLTLQGRGNISVGFSTSAGGTSLIVSGSQSSQQAINALSLSGNTATTNSSNITTGGFALAGGNGVTLAQSNNTISISVATNYQSQGAYLTTAAQSTQTLAFTLSGNSGTTNSSNITAGGYVLAGGNNITLNQSNNTISIVGPNPAGGAFSAGVSGGNTSNTSGLTGTGFALAGGNGVTLSQANNANGATVTVSVATNYQSQGAYLTTAAQSTQTIAISLSGNSATTNSSNITAGGYAFAGGNNITLQQSNNTISISAANQTVQPIGMASMSLSGNSATTNSSNITSGGFALAGGNNITLQQSNNTISISAANITNSSFSVQDSATTLNPVARIAFSTGNNITLSLSTGASSATVGVAHNLAGTSTGFGGNLISGSMTHNSSGLNLSLNHPAWLTTAAQSTQTIAISLSGNSATTNSSNITAGGYALAGGANVTLQQSNNTISISAASQSNQTAGIYNAGNTTGQSSSSTYDARTLNVSGAGIASVGWSAGSLIVSVPTGGGAGDGYNIVSMLTSTSGGGTAGATYSTLSGSIGLMAGSNITLSQTSNTINIVGPVQSVQSAIEGVGVSNVGNTAGNTGITTGVDLVFAGTNNITVSQSTGAAANTIWISGPNAGGGGLVAGVSTLGNTSGDTGTVSNQLVLVGGNNITLSQGTDANGATVTISAVGNAASMYPQFPMAMTGSTFSNGSTSQGAGGNSTQTGVTLQFNIAPMPLYNDVVFTDWRQLWSYQTAAATSSATISGFMGIYSLNGANLSLYTSAQFNALISENSQTAMTMSWWSGPTQANTSRVSGNVSTNIQGLKGIVMDQAGTKSLSEGQWYVGFAQYSTGVGTLSWMVLSNANTTFLDLGSANSSWGYPLYGQVSTTFTSQSNVNTTFIPTSIATANISASAAAHSRFITPLLRGK